MTTMTVTTTWRPNRMGAKRRAGPVRIGSDPPVGSASRGA
jgi:hypothetical protein